jgi:ATP-dependent DNA helicase RecG
MHRVSEDHPLPPAPSPLDLTLSQAGLPGVTSALAAKLDKGLGVRTVRDLLETVPRRYLDLSKRGTIRDLHPGVEATVTGKVLHVEGRRFRGTRHLLTVRISDRTGYLELLWWNQPFRERQFTVGVELVAAGRVDANRGKLQIVNPFVETLESAGVHTGRIIPVHPATAGVSATQIRRFVHDALERYGRAVDEPLGEALRDDRGYPPRAVALRELHFPTDEPTRQKARARLAFEELYVLSASLALAKRHHATSLEAMPLTHGDASVDRFLEALPFRPTAAQVRAIGEVTADLGRAEPMNRLLQGDVGAGKTVVALAAAVRAAANGAQAAIMAPTEILAEQHARSMTTMLEPISGFGAADGRLFAESFGIGLLTGSTPAAERRRILAGVADGSISILVGTHALIQEGVDFHRLAFAVVDEQHRFGVHQRVALRDKGDGRRPHTLVMTATPIPRTLALTVYGDLEVSILDELPPGRASVDTRIARNEADRADALALVRREVAAGHQAIVVCPLVEDSETLEVKAAEAVHARLVSGDLSDLRVGLMHGRLRPAEKEATMREMHAGTLDVLVATTVVEVGVDLPKATVLIVEDADRFGLSQLHQLRGRIGRSTLPSWCVLATEVDLEAPEREPTKRRLEAMVRTRDGFELAELDLELRGTGQLFGASPTEDPTGAPAQSGRSDLIFTNLLRDQSLLVDARAEAFAAVAEDPSLTAPRHAGLRGELHRRFSDRVDWLFAS